MDDLVTLRVCFSCGARSGNPARHGPTLHDELQKALRRASALSVKVEPTGCNDLCRQACSTVVLQRGEPLVRLAHLTSDATTALTLVAYADTVFRRRQGGGETPELPETLASHVVTGPAPGG